MDTETIIMRLIESDPSREGEYRLIQALAIRVEVMVELRREFENREHPEKYLYVDVIPVTRSSYSHMEKDTFPVPQDEERVISEATVLALRMLNSE